MTLQTESTNVQFKPGDIIFKEGDPGDLMYIVKKGEVELYISNQLVETVGKDGFFGEMALIDSQGRSAKAVAKTDVELSPLTEKQFIFMVQQTPFFSLRVLRTMVQRIRAMDRFIKP